jgi:5-methylcytosine-specific restriction endonuclease McrA
MFVWATRGNELYLLAAIEVKRSGRDWNEGRSLYGPYQIIPLRGLKWRIRFQQTNAVKLSREAPLARQVRARRRPTPQTARLLGRALLKGLKHAETSIRMREGQLRTVLLSKRERNRDVRIRALAQRGHHCEVCGFDFAKRYGEFATDCVEIHHLSLLSSAGKGGRTTTLEDIIVICPNCHRALHQFRDPANWKAFQKTCHLA